MLLKGADFSYSVHILYTTRKLYVHAKMLFKMTCLEYLSFFASHP
jgi:hypothetical protein